MNRYNTTQNTTYFSFLTPIVDGNLSNDMMECVKKHPISSCSGGRFDDRLVITESFNCSIIKRRTSKGMTRRLRRHHRIRTRANRRRLHSSLVLLILAFTSSSDFLVSSNADIYDEYSDNNEKEEEEVQEQRRPYRSGTSSSNNSRSAGGGRLKARLSRKTFHVTTASELNTSPWNKNPATNSYDNSYDNDNEIIVPKSPQEVNNNKSDSSPPPLLTTTMQKVLPFIQRGLLLFALSSLAVLERNPSSVSSILMSSSSSTATTATVAAGQGSFLFPFFSPFTTIVMKFMNNIKNLLPHHLNWTKLYNLPNELLPSLSSALLIAWVPSLFLQGAWWELSFLILSFTSSRNLRQYLITQIIPTLSSTIQKLIWSEFWKHIWEYILRPFPYNILIPTTITTNFQQQQKQESNDNDFMTSFQKVRLYLSDVWTKKVNGRIDKWTASSMKAVLQKNVQSSINSMVEDSFSTNDDITRMIEMEEEESNNNNDDDREISSLEDSEVVTSTAIESESELPLLSEEEIIEVVEEENVDSGVDDSFSSPATTMTTEQEQEQEVEVDDGDDDIIV